MGPLAPLSSLRLPSRRVCALLVLAFLGFGIGVGEATRASPDPRAAAPSRVVLLARSGGGGSGGAGGAPAASAAGGAGASEGEAGETEAPSAAPAAAGASTASTGAAAEGGSASSAAPPVASPPRRQQSPPSASGGSGAAARKLPPIKHVFVVMLSDEPYAAVFGPESAAHYLAGTLERRGELLVRYDAVAHEQLANELALLSGQGATVQTAANCPVYSNVAPATIGADEQVLGGGCVYPAGTRTLAAQLEAKRLGWRGYIGGLDEAGGPAATCAHPALGQADPTASAGGGPYATFRDPFVYFDAITASPACASNVVGVNQLKADLAAGARTPSFAYIAPDLCHDGSPTPCAPGMAGGLAPADAFLRQVVPQIMDSPAYKHAGLLVITVDEAPSSGEWADSSSCCGQPSFPNLPAAGASTRGGGTVGALLLSPYINGGGTNQEPYNHFSLLRTIEDLFALPHLGYAALPAVHSFAPSIFSARPRP